MCTRILLRVLVGSGEGCPGPWPSMSPTSGSGDSPLRGQGVRVPESTVRVVRYFQRRRVDSPSRRVETNRVGGSRRLWGNGVGPRRVGESEVGRGGGWVTDVR